MLVCTSSGAFPHAFPHHVLRRPYPLYQWCRVQVLAALLSTPSFDGDHERLGVHWLLGHWASAAANAGTGCEQLEALLRQEMCTLGRAGGPVNLTRGCPEAIGVIRRRSPRAQHAQVRDLSDLGDESEAEEAEEEDGMPSSEEDGDAESLQASDDEADSLLDETTIARAFRCPDETDSSSDCDDEQGDDEQGGADDGGADDGGGGGADTRHCSDWGTLLSGTCTRADAMSGTGTWYDLDSGSACSSRLAVGRSAPICMQHVIDLTDLEESGGEAECGGKLACELTLQVESPDERKSRARFPDRLADCFCDSD